MNGILGSAGPDTATDYDNNPVGQPTVALYYTKTGSMEFDSADVAALVANNTFYGVVLHEMAHVIGIGTLWDFTNELMTGRASNTFFVSETTLGGLDDLGYIVDYSKAGLVNHTVAIPEWSSLGLCLTGGVLLVRRRRS